MSLGGRFRTSFSGLGRSGQDQLADFYAELFGEERPKMPAHVVELPPRQGGNCKRGGNGVLKWQAEAGPQGLVVAKTEVCALGRREWRYDYDLAGRLVRVECDRAVVEEYAYDQAGRRVEDRCQCRNMRPRRLEYDRAGRLVLAGDERFMYDSRGCLARRETPRGTACLVYAPGGGLAAVHDTGGRVVEYEHGPAGLPLRKLVDGSPREEFEWLDLKRLGRWRRLDAGEEYVFTDHRGRMPQRVVIIGPEGRREYALGFDQVGTLKAVTELDGSLIKMIEYDSFGNVLHDSAPWLAMPLGFACGLYDRDTGLVRFGHRDYDSGVGRFTAPDPLGDTGGDHDPYEYCVDDPVNAVDPLGLEGDDLEVIEKGTKIGNKAGMISKIISGIGFADAVGDCLEAADDIHVMEKKCGDYAKNGEHEKALKCYERLNELRERHIRKAGKAGKNGVEISW